MLSSVKNYPAVILTDNSTSQRKAVAATFPNSVQLLCQFHVLQAFWRYLWNSQQSIPKPNRGELFTLLKTVISDQENFYKFSEQMMNHTLVKKKTFRITYRIC